MSEPGLYFLLEAGPLEQFGVSARNDRIYLVVGDEKIDISTLCSGWSLSASVDELRSGSIDIVGSIRVVERQV